MKTNSREVQIIEISHDEASQRLDNFLIARLKNVPKSMIYRIVRKGAVRVNKRRIRPSYRLSEGNLVRIPRVHLTTRNTNLISAKLKKVVALTNCILYEDDHLLILNKPSGTAVHGGKGLKFGVIEGLRVLRPEARFLELVHRLDYSTSGVLLVAKKRSALRLLHEQLRMKRMKKEYLALVRGYWKSHVNTIQAPLLKNALRGNTGIVRVSDLGKASETHFKVEERYAIATLVKATPITGRTHQIRVHALYAGHPIAFDNLYGDLDFDRKLCGTGLNRLFLHAASLCFEHPGTRETMYVKAPMDEALCYCLQTL